MGPYEAPLHACDNPEEVVPQKYTVFLHAGYSLEQHKQTVGDAVDFESAIRHIFPETSRHGLYYDGTLNDSELAAVRADLGVDMVECVGKVHLID